MPLKQSKSDNRALKEVREQLKALTRERDMLFMRVHQLENLVGSPEIARPKHGMSPCTDNEPETPVSTSGTQPNKTPHKSRKVELPNVPENTELPEDPVEDEMTVDRVEDTDSIIAPEEQQVTTVEKPICVVDGVGPGFQDHIPFATELHRVCKEAVAINIRKLSKGGWLVVFKDHENLKKFMDPWVWAQKPFGGSAKAHPPSDKRVTPDKPYPLEKAVKATRIPKEISDQAFKEFLIADGWKVVEVKSLPPATNLKRPPTVKNALVTFENQDLADKAIKNGLRFQCFFIRTEQFTVYPDPGVTRCFKCQAFGHVAARCEGTIVCSLCGEEGHGWQSPDCKVNKSKSAGVPVKVTCVNCKGEHHTGSKSCTLYREEKRRLYSEVTLKVEKAKVKASSIATREEPRNSPVDIIKFTESFLKGLAELSGSGQAGAILLKRLQDDLGGMFNQIKLPESK